ncbi:Receptor-like serine/threonine-protein kinase [Forsythia ovata]|uniref:Receptor-like serine/threonine-protein kinase n=1 Tax=Forsythia ovata TaxID=205694 RepID=A0ABD1QAN9_9LAMI
MARIIGGDQDQGKTKRVVGTLWLQQWTQTVLQVEKQNSLISQIRWQRSGNSLIGQVFVFGSKSTKNCSIPTGFVKFSGLKFPDTTNFVVNRTLTSAVECEEACLRNCSRMAYARAEVSECITWFEDLIDIRTCSNGGQDVFVRIPASELLLADQRRGYPSQDNNENIGDEDLELPAYDISTISAASDDFSFTNKIGEGGFGPVYKLFTCQISKFNNHVVVVIFLV